MKKKEKYDLKLVALASGLVKHKKIEICLGQNCKPYGGQDLADELKKQGVPFTTFECRSLCTYAPVVFVEGKAKLKASLDEIL